MHSEKGVSTHLPKHGYSLSDLGLSKVAGMCEFWPGTLRQEYVLLTLQESCPHSSDGSQGQIRKGAPTISPQFSCTFFLLNPS